jgi:hypothetical protein
MIVMDFNFFSNFVYCGKLPNVENIFGPLRFRIEQVLLYLKLPKYTVYYTNHPVGTAQGGTAINNKFPSSINN